MKPAFSVLIFTVSSGAGYGLLLWMLHFHLFGPHQVDLNELWIGGLVGLTLITLGLLSSTLHLANPKNAWRSFSRFRTSWLSREGVFAVLFYPLILSYGAVLWMANGEVTLLVVVLGSLSAALALAVVFCTGMIYASLKPIRQWHTPLTAPLYLLFSLMSGSLLYLLLNQVLSGSLSTLLTWCFIGVATVTAVSKWVYFLHIGKPAGSTINTATSLGLDQSSGVSQAQVRLLDAGHNADTFLTKEFVFQIEAAKLLKLRKAMVLCAFVLPVLLIAIATSTQLNMLLYLTIPSVFCGLLIERWLFFAEARHTVRLYHGDQRT